METDPASDASQNTAPLSTEPYRGVRDFYPEDMAVQNHIFSIMRKTAESFGYVEYGASILEPAELYEAKSGDELANAQTYQFTDRGNRRVALRPEMTPTLARMVARRRQELPLPLRLYSVPNVFRYERPQRGRTREHWQLNADIFGVTSVEAEIEIILLAHRIMRNFGAADRDFEICVNSRDVLMTLHDALGFSADTSHQLIRLIDRKAKMDAADFEHELRELIGDAADAELERLAASDFASYRTLLPESVTDCAGMEALQTLFDRCAALGLENVRFDPSLARGLDYYTGIVFEVFDTDPENQRSLFGGGRYDTLLEMFGQEPLPAVGFGMGDVTVRDFLDAHDLLPNMTPPTQLFICTLSPEFEETAQTLATSLRAAGLNVAVNLMDRKVGEQIKTADARGIPYVLAIGDAEAKSGTYTLKHLASGTETEVDEAGIVETIKHHETETV